MYFDQYCYWATGPCCYKATFCFGIILNDHIKTMMPHDFVMREGRNIKKCNFSCSNQAMAPNRLTAGY